MVRAKIDESVQINVYKKYKKEIFDANGKIKRYSDKIYKTLVGELHGMNEKSIHTSINRKVKYILTDREVNTGEFHNCSAQQIEDGAEADSVGSDGNENSAHYFPPEFVGVSMQFTDNDEVGSDTSLNHDLYELYHSKTQVNNAQVEMKYALGNILEHVDKAKNIFATITQQSGNEKLELNGLKEEHSESLRREASLKTDDESLRIEIAQLQDKKVELDRLKEENSESIRREALLKTDNESLRIDIAQLQDKKVELDRLKEENSESLRREALLKTENKNMQKEIANSERTGHKTKRARLDIDHKLTKRVTRSTLK